MLTINVRNVNEALPAMIMRFTMDTDNVVTRSPRGLTTIEWNAPVCTTYRRPMERVLFHPIRDANPFFHLFEGMWILAGRDDVKFLAQFLPKIAEYSDNGRTFNAAYGRRLRIDWGDQLRVVADMLRADPETRRAVAVIWHPSDLGAVSKDIPCNDLLAFRMRDGALDLTVYNRSNDVIWGAYGANAVQFAFILEYVAAMVGVPTGAYHQISNSWHIYLNPQWDKLKNLNPVLAYDPYEHYDGEGPHVKWAPAIQDVTEFDEDLRTFFNLYDGEWDVAIGPYRTQWFSGVIIPAWEVFWLYKDAKAANSMAALRQLASEAPKVIQSQDWGMAIAQWIDRRIK